MKSDIEIKDDVYGHIQESGLMASLTGSLEKNGKRPKDSTKEDVVISIDGWDTYRGILRASVIVNIYIADIHVNGQFVENTIRLRDICKKAENALKVGGLGKDFGIHLESQRVIEEPELNEHRIKNTLLYQFTEE